METNALYFGDNLKVLSEKLPDGTFVFPSESVDLIYLDPPFNSNRDYSVIFKEAGGEGSDAQIKAFTDSWHWGSEARDALEEITVTGVNAGRIPEDVGRLVDALGYKIGVALHVVACDIGLQRFEDPRSRFHIIPIDGIALDLLQPHQVGMIPRQEITCEHLSSSDESESRPLINPDALTFA